MKIVGKATTPPPPVDDTKCIIICRPPPPHPTPLRTVLDPPWAPLLFSLSIFTPNSLLSQITWIQTMLTKIFLVNFIHPFYAYEIQ